MPILTDIADVVHKGSAFRWKNKSQQQLMDDSRIPQDVNQFLDELTSSGVDYLLVGGIALLQYIDGRNTEDIDLILSLPDGAKIEGLVLHEVNEYFARGSFGVLTVDILRSENPFFQTIKKNEATMAEFLGRNLNTVTARGLILLKLYALPSLYRQHQHTKTHIYEADIQSLLEVCQASSESLMTSLRSYLPDNDLNELAKILEEFQQHRNRFS